jgi:hypothetical protein
MSCKTCNANLKIGDITKFVYINKCKYCGKDFRLEFNHAEYIGDEFLNGYIEHFFKVDPIQVCKCSVEKSWKFGVRCSAICVTSEFETIKEKVTL